MIDDTADTLPSVNKAQLIQQVNLWFNARIEIWCKAFDYFDRKDGSKAVEDILKRGLKCNTGETRAFLAGNVTDGKCVEYRGKLEAAGIIDGEGRMIPPTLHKKLRPEPVKKVKQVKHYEIPWKVKPDTVDDTVAALKQTEDQMHVALVALMEDIGVQAARGGINIHLIDLIGSIKTQLFEHDAAEITPDMLKPEVDSQLKYLRGVAFRDSSELKRLQQKLQGQKVIAHEDSERMEKLEKSVASLAPEKLAATAINLNKLDLPHCAGLVSDYLRLEEIEETLASLRHNLSETIHGKHEDSFAANVNGAKRKATLLAACADQYDNLQELLEDPVGEKQQAIADALKAFLEKEYPKTLRPDALKPVADVINAELAAKKKDKKPTRAFPEKSEGPAR